MLCWLFHQDPKVPAVYPHVSSSSSTEWVTQASPQAGKGPCLSPKTPGIYTKLLLQCVFSFGNCWFLQPGEQLSLGRAVGLT